MSINTNTTDKLSFLRKAYEEALELKFEAEHIGDKDMEIFWEEHCIELNKEITFLCLGIDEDDEWEDNEDEFEDDDFF